MQTDKHTPTYTSIKQMSVRNIIFYSLRTSSVDLIKIVLIEKPQSFGVNVNLLL